MKKKIKTHQTAAPADYYKAFASLVLDDNVIKRCYVTFGLLCRLSGAPKRDLDVILRRELGLGGRQLLKALRQGNFNKRAPFYCD